MSELDRTTLEETPTAEDLEVIRRQLGREPRGVVAIMHRCPCGCPTVIRTEPRLPDGTPFPTSFYATCPKLTGAISTLESEGLMKQMSQRLAEDDDLRWEYAQAHDDYLRRREELAHVPEIAGISAGGMPNRVKCLHVLVAHSLAAGPGVNPLGDRAIAALPAWWENGCCQGTETAPVEPCQDTCPKHHPVDPVGEAEEGEGSESASDDGTGSTHGSAAATAPDGEATQQLPRPGVSLGARLVARRRRPAA